MVLRTVNGVEKDEFVPHLAVTIGIGLAIASVGVFIYFIHHSASSIQVDQVIKQVGHDLDVAIDRLFPEKIGRSASKQLQEVSLAAILADFDRLACPIKTIASGYIQGIDDNQLMQIATENNLLLRVQQRPGRFVIPSPYRYDDHNQLRIIAEPISFTDAADAAFNQIRQYGKSSVAVTIRLLEAIAVIAPFTHRTLDRTTLQRHADMIERGSQEGIPEELDYKNVKERYLTAVKAIWKT